MSAMSVISKVPFIFLLLSTLLSLSVSAQKTVYKTVDEQGNVSFTDAPQEGQAAKSEKVEIHQANTLETESGVDYQQQFRDSVDGAEAAREEAWGAYYDNLSQAKSDLKAAQSALEAAQKFQPGDRLQTKTPNGSFSRESSQRKSRIAAAEAAVRKAESALQRARKQKPRLAKPVRSRQSPSSEEKASRSVPVRTKISGANE